MSRGGSLSDSGGKFFQSGLEMYTHNYLKDVKTLSSATICHHVVESGCCCCDDNKVIKNKTGTICSWVKNEWSGRSFVLNVIIYHHIITSDRNGRSFFSFVLESNIQNPPPLQKVATFSFRPKSSVIFWNACKNSFPIFLTFSFNKIMILSFW